MSEESLPQNEQNNESETEENNRQPVRSLGLDLGDDCVYNIESNRLGSQTQPGTSAIPEGVTSNPKREDNPFSFKHFLRDSSNSKSNRNYNLLGARPKVYRENRHNNGSSPESPHRTSHTSHNTRLVNEFSSALPDFVQDHLVVEQCFLGNKASANQQYDLDLPDFTQSDQRAMNGPAVSRSSSMDEPLNGPIPLDLPGLSLGNAFPLDLPVSATAPLGDTVRTTPLAEVGNSKSLPDFLTDGPVRSSGDGLPMPSPSAGGDLCRETVRCHHCTELRTELANARQRASRAEDEADKNSRKATVAENTVIKLKQELKVLKSQFRQLQSENQALRASMGAATLEGGILEMPAPRLAQELRAAASTAEHSLRSLLTGVDNLRMMASALENMSRIEEKTDRFSNFDDGSGPAL